jgi:ATP-dependent helicase HrpB
VPDGVREEREAVWTGSRVEIVARLRYGQLVLDESRRPPGPSDAEAAGAVLARAALERGPESFAPGLERWLARVGFVGRTFPDAGIAVPDAADALAAACRGAASLDGIDLMAALRAGLTPAQQKLLAEMAPDRVTLRAGRAPVVDYAGAPSIASRLQDFFGMTRTPAVAGGRVPLVLHLLAPNGRDVQVTTDLDGFWTRHYPAIRKELMRRYPKHRWPEDPRA